MKKLVAASLLAMLAGCLTRNAVVEARTFLPEPSTLVGGEEPERAARPELRLERVETRGHLRTPMVWRLSGVELFLDEANAWAREPAGIVEEWLQSALFGSGTFSPQELRPAYVLTVRVESFEGVLDGGRRARLRLSAILRKPDGSVAGWRTFDAEEPLERRSAEALARSLGVALGRASEDVRAWALASIPAS